MFFLSPAIHTNPSGFNVIALLTFNTGIYIDKSVLSLSLNIKSVWQAALMDSYSSLHVAFNICPKASLCILYMEVKPFCPDSHCRSSSSDNVLKESSKALYSSSLEKERIFSCKLLEVGRFSLSIGCSLYHQNCMMIRQPLPKQG